MLERGRGSDTVWGRGVERSGHFGIPVASASERCRLRDRDTLFVSGCVECTREGSGEPLPNGASIPYRPEGGEGKYVREVTEGLRTGIINGGL